MQYLEPEQYAADIAAVVDRAAEYNEIIGLRGSKGCAVLLSEEEYDALMETVHLMRNQKVAQDILEAAAEALEDGVPEEDVEW